MAFGISMIHMRGSTFNDVTDKKMKNRHLMKPTFNAHFKPMLTQGLTALYDVETGF